MITLFKVIGMPIKTINMAVKIYLSETLHYSKEHINFISSNLKTEQLFLKAGLFEENIVKYSDFADLIGDFKTKNEYP
jgi:hypothetical protein